MRGSARPCAQAAGPWAAARRGDAADRPAEEAGFLHDLADYTNRYGFTVAGQPGGPVLDGRAVFLAWFRRTMA